MKKISTVLILGLALLVPQPVLGAPIPDEQFTVQPPLPTGQEFFGYTRAYFDESFALNTWSTLIGLNYQDNDPRKKPVSGEVCMSLEASNCSQVTDFRYSAILDVCKSAADTNCIVGISASLNGGNFVIGSPVEKTTPQYSYNFTGDPSRGVPNGSTPSLWKFDGIQHSGGNLFLLNVLVEKNNIGSGSLAPQYLVAAIQPVSKKSGSFQVPVAKGLKSPDAAGNVWGIDTGRPGDCVRILSATECALAWPHPDGVKYKLEMRVSKTARLSNFMHGRVSNPLVSLSQVDNSRLQFTFEAEPVKTPFINAWRKNSDISPELNKILDKQFYSGGGYDGNCTSQGRPSCNYVIPPLQLNDAGREQYLLWLKEVGDKATGVKSMWAIRTLDSNVLSNTYGMKECIRNIEKISGIVSTNANVYVAGPPTFNSKTATLDYKVSSPHFDAAGNVNKGTYDLAISEELARCIYGFSSAPIKAEVSVFGEDGEKKIATTDVTQKNGWIYLSAKGFEYSVPVLRVKLSQEVSQISTQSAKTKTKKKSITCIKGKVTKKVSGTNPKCPAGFKKK